MKSKCKKALHSILVFCIGCVLLLMMNGAVFGIDAGYRLPEAEEIAQMKLWSSDAEKTRVESGIFTEARDIAMACNLLEALCDYNLLYMGVEDIPRLTVIMTLDDGSEYTVVVGDESVNFNGTFKGLHNKDAAMILTEQLLG